jgi:hypothetical protein
MFVYVHAGGWGPAIAGSAINIPVKDVMFLNNILVNHKNESAMWAHFAVGGTFQLLSA